MNTPTNQGQTSAPANGNGKAPAPTKALTVRDKLVQTFDKWKPTLRAVLPRHIDPERVIKIACKVYLEKPELQSCSPLSMVKATVQCAELGLDPSPLLGEAYFVPFVNKKKVRDGNTWREEKVEEVQLMPGYVGLVKLAKQTGDIADVYAVVVDEAEKDTVFDKDGRVVSGFYVEEGTVRKIHHVRKFEGLTGRLYAGYGVVKFKDGTHHFEVLTKADVEAIRKRSKAADNGPWVTDYNAMARKTAIKQALKTVPKSPEKPALAMALDAERALDVGEAFSTDMGDVIDTEGVPVEEPAAAEPAKPQSRAEELSRKLGDVPPHDPATGEVRG